MRGGSSGDVERAPERPSERVLARLAGEQPAGEAVVSAQLEPEAGSSGYEPRLDHGAVAGRREAGGEPEEERAPRDEIDVAAAAERRELVEGGVPLRW